MLPFSLDINESKVKIINQLLSFSWYYVVDFMEWKKLNVITNLIELLMWLIINGDLIIELNNL